jgi:hypothetical protein
MISKDWPDDALELVANKFLDDVEINDDIRQQTIEMCKVFHKSVVTLSTRYSKFYMFQLLSNNYNLLQLLDMKRSCRGITTLRPHLTWN